MFAVPQKILLHDTLPFNVDCSCAVQLSTLPLPLRFNVEEGSNTRDGYLHGIRKQRGDTLRTQACKCRCVNSVSKDTQSEVFTIVLDKRCCVKYGVARARARPGWQHLVKSVRHDSPNSAQQGFNKEKKNDNGRTKVENKGVAKKRTSCSHRAGAANASFNSGVHTSDK